jgi:hypothetical protein
MSAGNTAGAFLTVFITSAFMEFMGYCFDQLMKATNAIGMSQDGLNTASNLSLIIKAMPILIFIAAMIQLWINANTEVLIGGHSSWFDFIINSGEAVILIVMLYAVLLAGDPSIKAIYTMGLSSGPVYFPIPSWLGAIFYFAILAAAIAGIVYIYIGNLISLTGYGAYESI